MTKRAKTSAASTAGSFAPDVKAEPSVQINQNSGETTARFVANLRQERWNIHDQCELIDEVPMDLTLLLANLNEVQRQQLLDEIQAGGLADLDWLYESSVVNGTTPVWDGPFTVEVDGEALAVWFEANPYDPKLGVELTLEAERKQLEDLSRLRQQIDRSIVNAHARTAALWIRENFPEATAVVLDPDYGHSISPDNHRSDEMPLEDELNMHLNELYRSSADPKRFDHLVDEGHEASVDRSIGRILQVRLSLESMLSAPR